MKTLRSIPVLLLLLLVLEACSSSGGGDKEEDTETTDTADSETDTVSAEYCEDNPGAMGCACQFLEDCLEELVCDSDAQTCREPLACDDLDCSNAGVCQPMYNTDAICVSECQPGFEVDLSILTCVPVEGLTCIRGASNSIYIDCKDLQMTCVEAAESAQCGECFEGYALEDNVCVEQEDCADVNCAGENMGCVEAATGRHAVCDGCLPGFVEQNGSCVTDNEATCSGDNSIEEACNALNQYCISGTAESGARCGSCIDGFVENFGAGKCEAIVTCDGKDCATTNQKCEFVSTAVCTDCLDGYIKNTVTGECDATITCDVLDCPEATDCEPANNISHAYCFDNHGCGDDKLWSAELGSCVQCPVCGDDEGEQDYRWPELTEGSDRCICTTKDGYFFSDSTDLQVYPCDKDGDGWVRSDARSAIEKPDGSPLKSNARCDLRSINRFVLENEYGVSTEIPLGAVAYLYEPTRLDDDSYITANPDDFPAYNESSRQFFASELNPLTKACVSNKADFNNNDITDVTEWQKVLPSAGDWYDVEDFLPFTYFLELHNGWYENTSKGGAYYIQERSRLKEAFAGDHVPVSYPESAGGDYWQECRLQRDSWYKSSSTVQDLGMDFARFTNMETDSGGIVDAQMFLHSQFKCSILATELPEKREEEAQTTVLKDEVGIQYFVNECFVEPVSIESFGQTDNPSSPDVQCVAVESVANRDNGDVAWAAVGYMDYADGYPSSVTGDYVKGCINECRESPTLCEGYNPDKANRVMCDGQTDNYGKIDCGCGLSYAKSDLGLGICGTGCLGMAIASDDVSPIGRQGVWNCGGVSADIHNMNSTSDKGTMSVVGRVVGSVVSTQIAGNVDGEQYTLTKGSLGMTGAVKINK